MADVVTGSTSRIAAKTKEYEFNLCGYHDVIPHSTCDADPYFSEGAGGASLIVDKDHSTSDSYDSMI